MNMNKYTDEQLITFLQDFFKLHGKPPSKKGDGYVANQVTFVRRFGSWNNAMAAAGLSVRQCTAGKRTGWTIVKCDHCTASFEKANAQIKRTNHNFCSHSCAAKFQNSHKKFGIKRSKLETWIENELLRLYPNIKFLFNRRDIINSELDIFIPSLKLAFELNGIFHYEPIFGKERLDKIKNNDMRKFQACLDARIELCIIDSSGLNQFSPHRGKKYLDIVCSVIESNL